MAQWYGTCGDARCGMSPRCSTVRLQRARHASARLGVRAHRMLAAGSDELGCRTCMVAPRADSHTIRTVYLSFMIRISVTFRSADVLKVCVDSKAGSRAGAGCVARRGFCGGRRRSGTEGPDESNDLLCQMCMCWAPEAPESLTGRTGCTRDGCGCTHDVM